MHLCRHAGVIMLYMYRCVTWLSANWFICKMSIALPVLASSFHDCCVPRSWVIFNCYSCLFIVVIQCMSCDVRLDEGAHNTSIQTAWILSQLNYMPVSMAEADLSGHNCSSDGSSSPTSSIVEGLLVQPRMCPIQLSCTYIWNFSTKQWPCWMSV